MNVDGRSALYLVAMGPLRLDYSAPSASAWRRRAVTWGVAIALALAAGWFVLFSLRAARARGQTKLAMLAAGRGSIVNTSSLAGLRGLAHGSAYSASKHAVLGLTRSASNEYANDGVRVNAICPAAVDTNMTAALPAELRAQILAPQAMKRFAAPQEIGYAVAWLCSDAASFVTGVALPVDGGASAS